MIAIRFGQYLSLMLLVGLSAFPLYAFRKNEKQEAILSTTGSPLFFWLALAATISFFGFLAQVAAMMGSSIVEVDWQSIDPILFDTPMGIAWMIRMAALTTCLIAMAMISRSNPSRTMAVLITSSVALATLVWTGHAGATEGLLGIVHKVSDVFHMIAAAIWLGGIVSFYNMLRIPPDQIWGDRLFVAQQALDNFARIGTICVLAIAVTGLINSQILVGISNIEGHFTTTYGALLLLKLLLVGVMLLLAAKNRWQLTPALAASLPTDDPAQAVLALRRSLFAEAASALVILGLVAWFGMLEPSSNSVGN